MRQSDIGSVVRGSMAAASREMQSIRMWRERTWAEAARELPRWTSKILLDAESPIRRWEDDGGR